MEADEEEAEDRDDANDLSDGDVDAHKGGGVVQDHEVDLAFFWLALGTLSFWAFGRTIIRSPKVKLLGGGSEVSQVEVWWLPGCRPFAAVCCGIV